MDDAQVHEAFHIFSNFDIFIKCVKIYIKIIIKQNYIYKNLKTDEDINADL